MAKQTAAWGIDIGHCSLKALRCVPAPDGNGLIAEAFDYIEYPKILSQPDAEPEVLIREALQQFLSRNELKGDKIAISVSGQAGLSRFFQPPPVDARTLPDVVKYEAKQQIPFQLEDVIWDYQQIGGTEIDGLMVDAEVGIFAMKREAVFKALAPYIEQELEVDVIQLSPISIYNVVLQELLHDVPPADEIDPSNPPESLVVLSMGTDTTDLVITDGYKFWQRNIPIGGNHFTKQLARELKLTYAKAEHLKRNARKAEDPKTIFQAMKPVFNDLVTELQRSLSYFQGNHKKARLGRVMMLGNASKLPGLRQFLATSLSTEIGKMDGFSRLGGTSVTSSKQFEENNLSYAVCYGLCLQALDKSRLKTNLLPREFVVERVIRAKKPWALAGVAALLLGCSVNYFMNYLALWSVHPNKEIAGETWESAQSEASRVVETTNGFKTQDKTKVTELEKVRQIQQEIAGSTDGRLLWPELVSALYLTRPRDPRVEPGTPVDPKVIPYAGREEIYIDSIETVYFADLNEWLTDDVKDSYVRFVDQQRRAEAGLPPAPEPVTPDPAAEGTPAEGAPADGVPAEGTPADGAATDGAAVDPAAVAQPTETPAPATQPATDTASETPAAPTPAGEKSLEEIRNAMKLEGPGWVVQIRGHHYFNHADAQRMGIGAGTFVRNTFLKNLDSGKVRLPIPAELAAEFGFNGGELVFSMKQLGVKYPILSADNRPNYSYTISNPEHPSFNQGGSFGSGSMPGSGAMGSGAGFPGSGSSGLGGGSGVGASGNNSATGAVETDEPLTFAAPRYEFAIQIAWQPVGLRERLRIKAENAKKREAAATDAEALEDFEP